MCKHLHFQAFFLASGFNIITALCVIKHHTTALLKVLSYRILSYSCYIVGANSKCNNKWIKKNP